MNNKIIKFIKGELADWKSYEIIFLGFVWLIALYNLIFLHDRVHFSFHITDSFVFFLMRSLNSFDVIYFS